MNGANWLNRFSWTPFLGACSLTLAMAGWLNLATTAWAAEEASAGDDALFLRLDANHDGQLAVTEVPADHEQLFSRLLRRADADGNKTLSREEFLAGMVPSRPEKPLEPKQPDSLPQADAVRYLLLTLDSSGNSAVEASEVSKELQPVFERMLERLDRNKSGNLERNELNQGGPQLAQISGRYVQQEKIDVTAELKKIRDKQGAAADRFDTQRMPFDNLGDPKMVKEAFAQLDGNGDLQIELKEVPEPLQRPLERMLKAADRDGDGKLSEREFTAGAKRIAERQSQMAKGDKAARKAMTRTDKSKGEPSPEKQ